MRTFKTITLPASIIAMLFSLNAPADVPLSEGYGETQVVSGSNYSCALQRGAVYCWQAQTGYQDHSLAIVKVPPLKNPTQISGGEVNVCVIHDEGIKCWGDDESGVNASPNYYLKNPRQVSVGSGHACAFDDQGVHCWGGYSRDIYGKQFYYIHPPIRIKNPTRVVSIGKRTCALHDSGVTCWGKDNETSFEKLLTREDYQFTRGDQHSCELEAGKVQCQGSNTYTGVLAVPALKGPTQVISGSHHACALDVEALKCWGYYGERTLKLDLPIQISSGARHVCATESDGVRCWRLESFNEPIPIAVPTVLSGPGAALPLARLEVMPRILSMLTQDLARVRASFVQSIGETLGRVEKSSTPDEKPWARILIFNLLNPLISHLDSPALEKSLKPAYANGLRTSNQLYNVSSLQDIPRNSKTVLAALELARAALKCLRLYAISDFDRDAFGMISAAVERAIESNPVNTQEPTIRTVLEQFDLYGSLLNRMRTSYKTVGIALSLDAAIEFLRK